ALVVECAREDARRCRFADAAHPRQHIALGDAVGGERVPERRHHGVLADQSLEGGGTVLAGQHHVRDRLKSRLAVARAGFGRCFLLCHRTATSWPRGGRPCITWPSSFLGSLTPGPAYPLRVSPGPAYPRSRGVYPQACAACRLVPRASR